MAPNTSLTELYSLLQQHFGILYGAASPTPWWPIFGNHDEAPFEMLLASLLVQQTRWEAVETAILHLRDAELLAPDTLAQQQPEDLISLIRPVAFYNQKARGIVAISNYLCNHYQCSTASMLNQPLAPLRQELLALPRIGPETADVILLYAGKHPVFVIDDYTRRLLARVQPALTTEEHDTIDWARERYLHVQQRITRELTFQFHLGTTENQVYTTQHLYANYHALINEQCVRYCQARKPRCDGPPARRIYSRQRARESYLHRHDGCPLRDICSSYHSSSNGA